MSELLGIDLKIDADTRDLVLDAVGEPLLVKGTEALLQDIRHAIVSDALILAFVHADITPGDVRELTALVKTRAEADPRVVPGGTEISITKADIAGLEMEIEVLPIGQDHKENLIVRLGGFDD